MSSQTSREAEGERIFPGPSSVVAEQTRLRILLALFVFAFNICILNALGSHLLLDADTFWHVRVGHDILAAGKLPTRDVYSHTFFGQPWVAKEWLSQCLYYLAYAIGGWNLVAALAIAAISSAIALLFYFLSAHLRATAAIAVALIASFGASGSYLARPHVLTFPIIVFWTACLLRASDEDRAPSFWLLPLLVLWANLHASFPFAIMISGLCFLNFLERNHFSKRQALHGWVLFLGGSALAPFLNPYGYEVVFLTLRFMGGNEGIPYISEWRPLIFSQLPPHEIIVLAMIGGVLASGLRVRFAKVAFILLTLHLFLQHVRLAYLFYFLVPLIVSRELGAQFPQFSAEAWARDQEDVVMRFIRRHTARLTMAAALSCVIVTAGFALGPDLSQRSKIAPREALAFARSAGLAGNVLNYYDFGGFLVFEGIPTFIDGRSDQIYQGGFMKEIAETQKPRGEKALLDQLTRYDIAWTLLPPDDARVAILDRLPGWKRAYADEAAVIHVPQ